MNTDALVAALAADVPRVSRHAVATRLAVGVSAGAAMTLILVAFWLGFRPDLRVAPGDFAFWMKAGYTISLAVGASLLTAALARPAGFELRRFWLLAIPVVMLALLGLGELATTPVEDWLAMWVGQTWSRCPRLVLILSMPIFVGLLWSFRWLAPTRLRAAGAAAGFASGAWAATIYGLHCPEVSAIFVLTWYSLGIALAAGLGALLGPRLLRW